MIQERFTASFCSVEAFKKEIPYQAWSQTQHFKDYTNKLDMSAISLIVLILDMKTKLYMYSARIGSISYY